MLITRDNAGAFSAWYNNNNDALKAAGQQLAAWTQATVTSGKLPPALCGPGVSASRLQQQAFARNPAAGNPWTS